LPASGGVTIADLAAELGVTKSTVSRALNGYADISEATRERVRAAAQASGYFASSAARNLKRGRHETIGVVLPVHSGTMAQPFLAEFFDAVSRTLHASGYDLLTATARSREDAMKTHGRLIAARKVDGFILPRTEVTDPRVAFLRKKGVPFITHGRTDQQAHHAWFDIDNVGAFRSVVARLHGLGHKRIAFVGGPASFNFVSQRLEGYRDGLRSAGLTIDDSLTMLGDLDAPAGLESGRRLLALPRPPTAIVCATDAIAVGVIRALAERGLRAGREVSVTGYDDLPLSDFIDPPLTTFSQETAKSGERVAGMLLELIGGARPEDLQELHEAVFIQRASDGKPVLAPEALRGKLDAQHPQRRRKPHEPDKLKKGVAAGDSRPTLS
jgi:LacI family transcriptional regulator